MRIRQAVPADARAIAEVHVSSWRWAYRGLIPGDFLEKLSVDDRETTWRERLADPTPRWGCLVAEDPAARVVGFAAYGRDLFAGATDALRGFGFGGAFLWVLAANDRARRFYEKAGWARDGAESTHMFDCANEPIVRYVVDLG